MLRIPAGCALGLALLLLDCGPARENAGNGDVVVTLPSGSGSIVDRAGGIIVGDSGATVIIPPGALSDPCPITIDLAPEPPDFMHPLTPAYAFSPAGLSLALPATIELPLPEGVQQAILYLSHPDGSAYDAVSGAWTSGGFIHASVPHLGTAFAALPP